MLMYIVALAYAASSPMILPFTLAYFIVSWHVPHPRSLDRVSNASRHTVFLNIPAPNVQFLCN